MQNTWELFVNINLHFIGKSRLLFPPSAQKIKRAWNGKAICGGTIAKNKAVEAPAKDNAEQDAEADAKHNAVKQRKHKTEFCVADALNERAASAHDGERGEHPKDGSNEGVCHRMHRGVVGKEAEQHLSKANISNKSNNGKNEGIDPSPIHHPHSTLALLCRDILADHGHSCVLETLGYLIKNIVNAHADAERSGFYESDTVDERIYEKHRDVDTAGLDRHGSTEVENHASVMTVGAEAFKPKIEAERFSAAVEIKERKEEGDRLTDDGCVRGTCNTEAKNPREENVKHEIHKGCDTDKKEGAFRVAHTAQNGRNHVIARGENKPRATDDEVTHRVGTCLGGDIDPSEDGARQ